VKNHIPWPRLLVESSLIVLSILLAFAIDAGWANRVDRFAEQAALAGIEQDFRAHSQILRLNIARHEARLQAAERLIGSTGPGARSSENTVADLGLLGLVGPVYFQGGTLESLAQTSGLAALRDDELRVEVSRWMQSVEDLQALNGFLVDEGGLLLDYLRTRQSLQDLDRAVGATTLPPSGFEADVEGLLGDLEFSNIVYQQHYASTVFLISLRNMASTAEAVLERIGGT
jgi:hypothetical protein